MRHTLEHTAKMILNVRQVERSPVEGHNQVVLLHRLSKIRKILVIHVCRIAAVIEHAYERNDPALRRQSGSLDVHEGGVLAKIGIQPPTLSRRQSLVEVRSVAAFVPLR